MAPSLHFPGGSAVAILIAPWTDFLGPADSSWLGWEKRPSRTKRIKERGMVQLCTTVDAWAPDAQEYDLGRRCLEAILAQPGWTVRILTTNAAVAEDFDLIKKHRDRVLVGISLTGTPDKEAALSVIEPNASPISERMKAVKKAHKLGLRTYGMLCPLLPGIGNAPEQIDRLVRFVKECGADAGEAR